MADRISARRGTANSFFLTLHTGLSAFVGVVTSQPSTTEIDDFAMNLTYGVGITLAFTWWVLLRSYRDLNTAKFDVIMKLEQRLPAQIFTDEWAFLKRDPVSGWRSRYAELGFVERTIPVVFAAVYALMLIRTWW